MNLHRVGKRPDWHLVVPEQRNPWQRIAARTHGILTPANLLSIVGIALVILGAFWVGEGNFLYGLIIIAIGRVADLFDGIVADRTGTKSPLGEALDAALDKLSILVTLIAFVWQSVIPAVVLVTIIALNILTTCCGVIAKLRKQEFHSNRFGKLSMAGVWIALFVYGAATVVGSLYARPVSLTADGVFVVAVSLGLFALADYISVAFHRPRLPAEVAKQLAVSFEQFLIVSNPASTNARIASRRIAELHKLFPQAVFYTIITSPEGREANRKLLEEYADKLGPGTLICIAAGDGTANLVIEWLLTSGNLSPAARQTPVLPLWGGNANDLAYMLNGFISPARMQQLFDKARLVPIYPLECIMRMKRQGRVMRLAACYASFGASAYAAQRLNEPLHRKSWLHALPGGRFLMELATVASAFAEALPFSITENGTVHPVYERIFANGSRIARLDTMPVQLSEGGFYRVTVENKHPSVLALRLFHLIRRRWPRKSFRKPARFTTRTAVWAQFDGEALRLPDDTKVTIRLSREPFFALSTKLSSGSHKELVQKSA